MKLKQLQRKINQEKFDIKGLEVVMVSTDGQTATLATVELDKENKVVLLHAGAETPKDK